MTYERKDEIWAMLPEDLKELAQLCYNESSDICINSRNINAINYYNGIVVVLRALFGQNNLSKNNGFKQCR